jgi:hypothetical protein
MRTLQITVVLALGAGLISCSRRDEPAARQVGREAYDASHEIKRGAKNAAKEIREAGKELREGWSERRAEVKNEDPPPPKRR